MAEMQGIYRGPRLGKRGFLSLIGTTNCLGADIPTLVDGQRC